MKSKTVAKAKEAEEKKPKCLVLSGFGLNAELELAYAFSLAGADAKIVHFSDIASNASKLEDFQIFAIPGGWSFADEISSGSILANKLRCNFRQQFDSFAASKKPILGICNGFQTLVKLGALPNMGLDFSQEVTLLRNARGRFENRWVYLKPQKSVCRYFDGVEFIHCPVRHGEGQFIPKDNSTLTQLEKKGLIAARYVGKDMLEGDYPVNPNGSVQSIAGICNTTGRILAMMPHPECSVLRTQFPRFNAGISFEQNSIRLFSNIVEAAKEFV
jgi:phosphoribosylformylglycinamidine synthase subunit PurQ / glutaminase